MNNQKYLQQINRKDMVRGEIPQPFFMTIEYGVGMLAIGILGILVGAVIAYKVINIIQQKEKQRIENENRKHIHN